MAFVLVERLEGSSYYVPEHRVLAISYNSELNKTFVTYRDEDEDLLIESCFGKPAFIGLDR